MSEKCKILHSVSIMDRAGEETFIMNVFRTIDKSKYMFDFLVSQNREGEYDKEIVKLGGKIHCLEPVKTGGPIKRLKNYSKLNKYLRGISEEYSAFHIHTQHAMDAFLDAMAAKRAGIRNVIVHSHSTSTLHHVKAHYIFRPILNRLHIVRLACSDKAGKWLFGDHGKYEVINNGIVVEKYLFNDAVREEIRKNEAWGDRLVIGHVGSFSYPKNHSFLLDIFKSFLKIFPDAILAMAGKGNLMEEIKEKSKELRISDSVVFLGSRGDVNRLYSAFDALVFPSHYEGLPVTLVEAQAADLPCLISDTITTETDINPSLIRMSLENSADEWAKELDLMISSSHRGNAKKQIVDAGYDIETTTERLTKIYSGKII